MDKSQSPVILLVGAAGGPNFGDEAILGNWVRAIQNVAPDRRIICDGFNLSNVQEFLAGATAAQSDDLSLWSHVREIASGSFASASFSDMLDTAKQPGTLDRLLSLSKGFHHQGINHIHFIGGGYFNAQWPTNYLLVLLANALASMNNIHVTGSGHGLLPVSPVDARLIAAEFSTWQSIDVRDQESLNFLESHGLRNVTYSGDDALLLYTEIIDDWLISHSPEPAAVICIQNHLFPGDQLISSIIGEPVIRQLHQVGMRQIFLIEAMHSDILELPAETVRLCNELAIQIRPIPCQALLANGLPVHPDSIFITSRYHPHFFGVANGCRGISLAANNYYETKHRALAAIGSTWPICTIDDCANFTNIVENVLSENFIRPNNKIFRAWANRKKHIMTTVIESGSHKNFTEENYISRTLREIGAANVANRQLADDAAQDIRNLNAALTQQSAEASKQLRELRLEMNQRLGEVQQALEVERSNLHTERMQRYSAEYEVFRYQNSLSWKVTQPLRTIASKLRCLRALVIPTR